MVNKVILDENVICDEYTQTQIGIEKLALKYHVGKYKIKQILEKNNIQHKKRGGQNEKIQYVVSDWKIEKYPQIENKHYVLTDKLNDFTTTDIKNLSGVVTSHIKNTYNIETPTLFFRRKYYMETGNYWWEQWFNVTLVDNKKTKKCPYCDWETVDIDNRSGMFETHLRKVHNISKQEYLKEHPEDRDYFIGANAMTNRQIETNTDKFVTCQVCGKKMARISNAHLKLHGLTKLEYIHQYHTNELLSNEYYNVLKKQSFDMNNALDNSTKFTSKDENEIYDFISNTLKIECKHTDRKILKGKELDILIPSKNIAIEFNGNKWHTEWFGNKTRLSHLNKLEECISNNIGLIQIFEDEYNLHKPIVLSKISHILNVDTNKDKIYGRKCSIREINSDSAKLFLEQNHIQGYFYATAYIGAFYNDKLVGVMSFINEGKNMWNLNRFATDINYNCIGIGGKLFNYFIKNYNFKEIKSFADRRWTVNYKDNLYTKLGFKLDSFTPPNYSYYNPSVDRFKRFHKFAFRKKRLNHKYGLPLTMTETEMVKELGYDRIWDCGLIKYVYKK